MKQQERTQRTMQRILAGAVEEFGTNSYENASINTICAKNRIAKGLVYHNFKGKDELYLECVRICYEHLLDHLRGGMPAPQNAQADLQKMMQLRQEFFEQNPHYSNIFFNTVLHPPRHLQKEIGEIRRPFEEFCTEYYRCALQNLTLREGISADTALNCFVIFAEMFNGYFQAKTESGSDYRSLIEDHEGKLCALLDILLYGIACPQEPMNQ